MAEETQVHKTHPITLEIIREGETEKNWLNRFCRDANTHVTHLKVAYLTRQKILYYCEVDPDSKLVIHRGDQSGPIIATANACLATPGVTDVRFEEPLYTIELEHILQEDYSKTEFVANGKSYHWKGHSELVESKTDVKLAEFYPSWLISDVKEHKLGNLVIHEVGHELIDLAVITALTVMERSDEHRQAVYSLRARVFSH